ncbi:MAG: flagellar motor protein MotB [Psychromonas sp.]
MRMRPRSRMQMQKGNNLDRWTVSFADFMTLMFAVFVVLYAVSVNDKEQYKEVMLSIQNASKLLNKSLFSSNNEGVLTHDSNTTVENVKPALKSNVMTHQATNVLSEIEIEVETIKEGRDLGQIKTTLEKLFLAELGKESIVLDLNGDWLTIEMGGNILYAAGSHTLLNSAKNIVNKLSKVLIPVNNLLRIRGYSDNERIANEIYYSNWELSGMRAFSVLHALNRQGISGERMVVEAYGRYSPVLNENNRVNPLKSRRVVIAISKYAVVAIEKNSELPKDKSSQEKPVIAPSLIKKDSQEMREMYLPNDRLIITTRKE